MLLVQNADVLLLDEPVAGMSHEEREETGNLLRRIGGERTSSSSSTTWTSCARSRRRTCWPVTGHRRRLWPSAGQPKVQEVYLGTAAAGSTVSPTN